MRNILLLVFFLNDIHAAVECPKSLTDFTSPICTDAKYIFWTGVAVTSAFALFRESFLEDLAKQTVAKDHLGSYGKDLGELGKGYLNLSYFLYQYSFNNVDGKEKAAHMAKATLYSLGTTMALKKTINESRPGYPEDYDSFPSGHSSAAFAFASVVGLQHGMYWGVSAHTLALLIAFSRMDENWHFLHDVLTGITIGLSYGYGVYHNHLNSGSPLWFSVLPGPYKNSAKLNLSYSF